MKERAQGRQRQLGEGPGVSHRRWQLSWVLKESRSCQRGRGRQCGSERGPTCQRAAQEESHRRGWEIRGEGLGHPAEPPVLQGLPPQQPWACAGSSEAAGLSANVKANLSWQHPSPPASLVSRPLWDVSPSAFRNVAVPPPISLCSCLLLPSRSSWATVSDVSVQIQSPVLQ